MEAVRSALGLSEPAEFARLDRRYADREARLKQIDRRIEVDFAADRKALLRRRATDR